MNHHPADSRCHPIALEELPTPFRRVLEERLTERPDHMLYSPPLEAGRWLRASLLVLTPTGWLALHEVADGGVAAHHANYDDTLLLERSTVLHHGTLRLDYVSKGSLQTVSLPFDAARADDYEDAVYRFLGSIDKQPGHFVNHGELDARLDALPLRFHNSALHYLPLGRQLEAVVHWPACLGAHHLWSTEELAPEAMLLLTDRELILVSEERTRSWLRLDQPAVRYGSIVTYLPLARLGDCRMEVGEEPLAVLEVELHAGNVWSPHDTPAADMARIGLPRAMVDEVAGLIEAVEQHRPSATRC